MPELLCAKCRYETLDKMEADLKRCDFVEIPCDKMDPTIRRVCERVDGDSDKSVSQMELVRALREGGDRLPSNTSFGMMSNNKGVREYVGISKKTLQIVWAGDDYVKKRRRRYTLHPLPTNERERWRFVQSLIFEIVKQWSSKKSESMGASYAQIYHHVADYSNIEIEMARELVDVELPRMEILEKSVGDHWRIKPDLLDTGAELLY